MRIFTIFILLLAANISKAGDALGPAFEAIEARDFVSAIARLEGLPGQNRDVLFHLARVQYISGRFEAAADTLDILHDRFPDDADAYYLEGLVNLARVGEVNPFRKISMAKAALESWETAVETDPSHLNARYAIFAYHANAPGIVGGDVALARTMQQRLQEINAGFGAMAKALLLSKDDDITAAEAAYQEAAIILNRAGPHFALAQFYLESERYDKVSDEIDLFLDKEKRWWDPDVTVAHLLRARANAALGNSLEARAAAKTALSMNPSKQVREMLLETMRSLD